MLSQDYPRIEYIVVDGGSTDETLALLEKYRGRLRFITGKGKGPSDAIHRGFSQAKGEILGWINADDTYLPGAVRTGVEFLEAHAENDVVYGEGYWVDENGGPIDRYPSLPFDERMLERDCFICQPASVYRRSGLDPDLGLSFDYDLWIRLAKQGSRFSATPRYLANSRMHGAAKTLRDREGVFLTSMDLLQRHYGCGPLVSNANCTGSLSRSRLRHL